MTVIYFLYGAVIVEGIAIVVLIAALLDERAKARG